MSNINQTMNKIINNQNLIENKVEQLRRAINESAFNYAHYLEIHDILNKIKIHSDSQLNFLSVLKNAINFANLRTMHHIIVPPVEIKDIITILQNSHSDS